MSEFAAKDTTKKILDRNDFDFELPQRLIAQNPAEQRELARLLVYNKQSYAHHIFADLPKLLAPGTLLIANNTKVIPSRLAVNLKSGAEGELFLLEQAKGDPAQARALARPRKKLLRDQIASLGAMQLRVTVTGDSDEEVLVKFPCSSEVANEFIDAQGIIPLPPYIKRVKGNKDQKEFDRTRYQTTFHQIPGSAAAPTAGLHFSQNLMHALEKAGHKFAFVTLHVGLGTFAPMRTIHLSEHQMHTEHYRISKDTLTAILNHRKAGKPVVFVGTTSLRAVESFFRKDLDQSKLLQIADDWHSTNLFLFPRHAEETIRPKIGNGIITNFHLPQSTLFMLVSALMGVENVKNLYKEAVNEEYRFFSYGDASLLLFQDFDE